ncbi:MAG: hypothetical protein GEU90_13630 [Gemmatimonas sp.]|nr:hypothetical protein [Gemmatimonas sp.]
MTKLISAAGLGILALFMLVGLLNSGASWSDPATLAAVGLVIGLPAAGAGLLARSHFAERDRLVGRKAELRRQTVESEILRFAKEQGARLTAVEVATHLAMTPEGAKEALDGLVVHGQADLAVTEEGVLVYTFHDVQHLGSKSTAKGILDA